MATWVRLIGGALLVLIGLVWIGQGFDLIKGSGMSGHGQYAAIGLLVVLGGLWLVWGPLQMRIRAQRR